ncbi:hypothetical protein M0805_004234 [Coniferiporia weirii]|nr:hypothetical protein M0805_004234 [Coniferiporia weirii]
MLPVKTSNAADVLDEIQSESASQLMNSVLYQLSPPGSTGLASLDAHLLFSTPQHASPTSALNRGDVIEIQGPAASGKTQLVYHLTMKCVLPQEITLVPVDGSVHQPYKVDVGGWCKAAAIINTDGRWNIQRLKSFLTRYLDRLLPTSHEEFRPSLQELVAESLQRVHVFCPVSSASLAATLLRLPAYHAECMPSLEIALLAVDSISAFYWLDRYALEQRRQSAIERKDVPSPLGRVLVALQEFRLSHGPVIVLTNWGLAPLYNDSTGTNPVVSQTNSTGPVQTPFYRQHLHPFPAPFEVPPRILPSAHIFPPITHHITLSLPTNRGVPFGTTFSEEAIMMGKQRVAEEDGEITGFIRTVVEGSKINKFTFHIHDDELLG